jgi:hypothetical protein
LAGRRVAADEVQAGPLAHAHARVIAQGDVAGRAAHTDPVTLYAIPVGVAAENHNATSAREGVARDAIPREWAKRGTNAVIPGSPVDPHAAVPIGQGDRAAGVGADGVTLQQINVRLQVPNEHAGPGIVTNDVAVNPVGCGVNRNAIAAIALIAAKAADPQALHR